MTNIAKRLRTTGGYGSDHLQACDDAADELKLVTRELKVSNRAIGLVREECERLRAALEEMLLTAPWDSESGHTHCIKLARKALSK